MHTTTTAPVVPATHNTVITMTNCLEVLATALGTGNIQVVMSLVQRYTIPKARFCESGNLLHLAASSGKVATLVWLTNLYRITNEDIHSLRVNNGLCPLMGACKNNSYDMLEYLIDVLGWSVPDYHHLACMFLSGIRSGGCGRYLLEHPYLSKYMPLTCVNSPELCMEGIANLTKGDLGLFVLAVEKLSPAKNHIKDWCIFSEGLSQGDAHARHVAERYKLTQDEILDDIHAAPESVTSNVSAYRAGLFLSKHIGMSQDQISTLLETVLPDASTETLLWLTGSYDFSYEQVLGTQAIDGISGNRLALAWVASLPRLSSD